MKTNMKKDEDKKITKTIFCAKCQDDTAHELSNNQFGDIVATCPVCGQFLKFPASITKEEFKEQIEKNKEVNKGQVTQEAADKKLLELAADDDTEE
jgi:uncharacterized Zn finger protein